MTLRPLRSIRTGEGVDLDDLRELRDELAADLAEADDMIAELSDTDNDA